VRLFVALDLPDPVRADLAALVERLRAEAPPGLRWPAPERWHLTVAFLGDVDDARQAALLPRLARVAGRHPALPLQVAGGGRFDGRVLWAGLDGDTQALGRLAASVAAQARHAGVPMEDRPYRAHLTLARSDRPRDLRPLVERLAAYRGPRWTADAVHLVRSDLGPSPRYRVLGSWALIGAA
jgi:2'-5' RNA ligase